MKPAVRALSLAIIILWILIIVFSVTAVYSVMKIGIDFGEPQAFPSSNGAVFSLPFFINNSGYYDISKLNVTTRITDYNGTLLTQSNTFVPLVSGGSNVKAVHNVYIDLSEIMPMDYIELFFNDSFFGLDTFVTLNFAHVIPVQISANATIPWGAPFYNVSVGDISILPHNSTHGKVVITVSFENHSLSDMVGTMQLEIYNDVGELVTSGKTSLNVPSQHDYDEQVDMYLSLGGVSKLTESGKVCLIFETPMFRVERWVPYG